MVKSSKIPELAVPFEAEFNLIKEITVAGELASDGEQNISLPDAVEKKMKYDLWNTPHRK